MTGRILGRAAKLAAAVLAGAAILAIAAGAASAAPEVIYDNIPSALPGNFPSVGFEATQTSEFGGAVGFAGTARKNPTVIVTMSSFACEEGTWFDEKCSTKPGGKVPIEVKFSVYEVEPITGAVGAKIAGAPKIFMMPYRPSANLSKCKGAEAGKWFSKGTCYNGKAFKIIMPLKIAKLPENAIISVAYNTSGFGPKPNGYNEPCNSETQGCFYDSLNVAVREKGEGAVPTPGPGSFPRPEDVYLNSTTAGNYCKNEAAVGTFALSKECWSEEQPAIEVKAQP